MGLRHRINRQVKIGPEDNEVIVAYKKGSGGEIVRTYNSISEIVRTEQIFNGKFSDTNVIVALQGARKSTKLLHCQAVVVLRIKKIADVKEWISKSS